MKIFSFILFLLVSSIGVCQDPCGTDEIQFNRTIPSFFGISRSSCSPSLNLDTVEVITLPIVVHVVHLGEPVGQGTNISDEQILSSLEALNADFRKIPGSAGDGYGVDTKIQFCLARRTPSNEPTNGISRYDASDLFWFDSAQNTTESYLEDGIANVSAIHPGIEENFLKSTVGCWNPNEYINFYLVSEINGNNAGGGVQGYAYLYPTGDCKDGIVQLYNTFGTIGNIQSFGMNRTTTHEMGHYLGLFHTFQGSGSIEGCDDGEINCCTSGDQVCDTPPQPDPGQSCSVLVCPDILPHNYMDYTPESCRNLFTQGQTEKMRYSLATYRSGLIESLACQPIYNFDVGISVQGQPPFWCRDVIDLNLILTNHGLSWVESCILEVNGVQYEIGEIQSGEFISFPLENYPFGNGEFLIQLILDSDEYLENNFSELYIPAEISQWLEIEINTDFFAGETDWELSDQSGNIILERGAVYPSGFQTYTYGTCLTEGCYEFTITDNFGDGMQFGGSYEVFLDGESIISWGPGVYSSCNPSTGQGNPSQCWFEQNHEFCVVICDPVVCHGDFNNDGIVSIDDLLIFLTRYLEEPQICDETDLNGDESIDGLDLNIFISNYGLDCGSGNFIVGMEFPYHLIENLVSGNEENLNYVSTVVREKIYDIYGKELKNDAYLAPGVYIIREFYSDGNQKVVKIIRN